jgi:hypothetical protein
MPHSSKEQNFDDVATASDLLDSFDDLGVDVLADILSFLEVEDIMHSRRINKKTMEAVKMTLVPLTPFIINSVEKYNAMAVMARAMPNLQQITIGHLGDHGRKYSDGEDPKNEWYEYFTSTYISHDIRIISNFSKLRVLEIYRTMLNGRYPVLFNFPLLQKLSISYCGLLKFDLEMIAGLPLLKELTCQNMGDLTGNIRSLRVLKDTLEKVKIISSLDVEGNFMSLAVEIEGNIMDLSDFPHLKELKLDDTAVTGDIRDIGEDDFPSLEKLDLPRGVYGGVGCEFQRISDGPDLITAVYLLNKQRLARGILFTGWYGELSRDSADRYESVEGDPLWHIPPFRIRLVKAGSRIGYRWETCYNSCEVNWLDPEPDRESSDYDEYIEELQKIERQRQRSLFRGFHQPPTEEEFNRLCNLSL